MDLKPHEELRVRRHRAAHKRAQAAHQLGCGVSTLAAIEAAQRPPSGALAASIERVYGIAASRWYPAPGEGEPGGES